MKRSFYIFFSICILFACCSCGHNFVRVDKGTGGIFRIPLPNGDSLLEIKGGEIDSTTAVIRGGSTFSSGRSVGGSLNSSLGSLGNGSGSSASDFQISTSLQLNEGYLRDVLVSPNVSSDVKMTLINYLINTKPNELLPSKTASLGASSGKGGDLSDIQPNKTISLKEEKSQKQDKSFWEANKTIIVLSIVFLVIVLLSNWTFRKL